MCGRVLQNIIYRLKQLNLQEKNRIHRTQQHSRGGWRREWCCSFVLYCIGDGVVHNKHLMGIPRVKCSADVIMMVRQYKYLTITINIQCYIRLFKV